MYAGLVLLGGLLLATAIPAVFIVDEENYLVTLAALRKGRVSVPGTDGLRPSSELLFFEPTLRTSTVRSTPVSSTAPPLYAIIAYPFSFLGWHGLVGLNVLAYLASGVLCFSLARRAATRPETPWIAASLFLFFGFNIEYAQGLWPQMLSVFLCLLAFWAVAQVRHGAHPGWACLGGFAAGLAAGVRYQNAVLALFVALGLLWGTRRCRALASYLAGFSAPVLASAWINAHRIGGLQPFSKGGSYARLPAGRPPLEALRQAIGSTWGRVVDYSLWPPFAPSPHRTEQILPKDPVSGAFLILSAVKKSLIQSAPWVALALVALALAWSARSWLAADDSRRRELRAASLVVAGMLALFGSWGFPRHDGWSFNQRYLLELVPLLAIAASLAAERVPVRLGAALAGGLVAVAGASAIFVLDARDPLRQVLLMKTPIALAAAFALAWLAAARLSALARPLAWASGACLGWALTVQLCDDLAASRTLRRENLSWQQAYERSLPPGKTAVFAHWGVKDRLGGLILSRDVVILDTFADDGRDAPGLVDDLLRQGRRVFVATAGFPMPVFGRMVAGRTARVVPPGDVLAEIVEERDD